MFEHDKENPFVNTRGDMQDFTNTETKIPTVIGISVFMMVLATTTTAARFYTRIRILRMTGLDDWLVLASWALIVGHGITQCLMTRVNLGRHVGSMTNPEDFPTFFKMFYASLIMYNAALMSIKLAFLAQYYRIMTGGGPLRRTLIIVSGIIGLWSTSQMVVVIFQCQPVSGFWAPTPDTVCVPSVPGLYISAAGNIVSDLIIVVLPLPMIKGLNLPLAQRLVLSLVFCLGLVTTAISLLRLKFLRVSPDLTWDIADSNLCSLAEISSGVTCACLPTLKPLAAQAFPKLFSTLRTQFTNMRAPTPEWKPRNLKEMLRDDASEGSVKGLPLAYLSLESLQLRPLQLRRELADYNCNCDNEKQVQEASSFPPHPGVRRSTGSRGKGDARMDGKRSTDSAWTGTTQMDLPQTDLLQMDNKRSSLQTLATQATSTRSNGPQGNTVEIEAAYKSLKAFYERKSQRISQSSSSIYVKREVTVEVEDDWA